MSGRACEPKLARLAACISASAPLVHASPSAAATTVIWRLACWGLKAARAARTDRTPAQEAHPTAVPDTPDPCLNALATGAGHIGAPSRKAGIIEVMRTSGAAVCAGER